VTSAKPKAEKIEKTDKPAKRLNRAAGLAEALGRALDPALKRRGFANEDLLRHWRAIAPPPYNLVTRPVKLSWPKRTPGADGAILHVSCHPGHSLMLQHEGPRLMQAVNAYFGYVLVAEVRLSSEPFLLVAEPVPAPKPDLSPARAATLASSVGKIADEGLRAALQSLGRNLMGKKQD
jgi:hypothetical protein